MTKRSIPVCVLLATGALAADLPVRQVILYKHGVGYFERSGQLAAGESARLDFKAAEMNDVLKSLTVEEKGGGKISGLRYDSSEPLSQKLGEFPFQLQPGTPLSAVLDQLKGARLEMKFGNETVAGAIVSGRLIAGDDKRPEREQITLLLDGGDLRTFDLSAAASLRFNDPKLQSQFKDYLTVLTNARSKEKRSVYIDSTDAKSRQLIAGYMIPTPVWKSSYRLIFGDTGRNRTAQFAAASPPPAPVRESMASGVVSNTTARELGDLFEYRINTPVTVRKSESAMLPFLQQKIDARKLLIYSDQSSVHPMNAAEVTNSSGKTLDGGPITVYDAGAYAGEALVETVKQGDKRLISYAVDLGTRITTAFDSKAEVVRELHLRRGVLTTRVAAQETRTYTIKNVDAKAKTLIIEHPVRPQYTLLDRKPSEKTPRAYRFEVKLAAGDAETFPVVEERVYDQTYAVSSLTPDVLVAYIQNKTPSDGARKQLEQIATQKRQIAEMDNEIRRTDAGVNELVRDQDRMRSNIGSLNQVSGQQQQVQTYARQLAAQESQIATLRDRSAELKKKKAAAESALNVLIESAGF